jgi:hypothetical protein
MVILPAGTGNLSRDRTTRRNPLAAPQTAKSRADHRGGETTDFFQSFRRKTGGSVYAKTNAGQGFSLAGAGFPSFVHGHLSFANNLDEQL